MLENIDISKYVDITIEGVMTYTPKFVGALLTLWIWFKIISIIIKIAEKAMKQAKIDKALKKFIESIISAVLKILLILTAIGMIWVQTTSFIAILWAAGLAFGMALSGTLQNFAGWVMILLFKPFKIWDFIEVNWFSWVITEVQIFNTYLETADKRFIIIPNSEISGKSLTNYTTIGKRLVEFKIGVAYDEDTDSVKNTLVEIAKRDKRIIQKEPINVFLAELADSAVIFKLRVIVKTPDYWPTYFAILEDIKKTFDKKWISFPFPQRDVHIFNEK